MFGRKKEDVESQASVGTHPERVGAKNRPTPKRREAEAANRRPIVPADRKAAAKAERERLKLTRLQQRQALQVGDERHLPPRDAGPERRLVRDVVDSRVNLGELYLPLMIVLIVLMIVPPLMKLDELTRLRLSSLTALFLYAAVLMVLVDTVFMWRKVKKVLFDRFGADTSTRGLFGYAFARSVQIRRFRRPPVVVKRGQAPR